MFTGKWELVVIWDTNDKSVYEYDTEREARNAERGMWVALGNQIAWQGVRKQIASKESEV